MLVLAVGSASRAWIYTLSCPFLQSYPGRVRGRPSWIERPVRKNLGEKQLKHVPVKSSPLASATGTNPRLSVPKDWIVHSWNGWMVPPSRRGAFMRTGSLKHVSLLAFVQSAGNDHGRNPGLLAVVRSGNPGDPWSARTNGTTIDRNSAQLLTSCTVRSGKMNKRLLRSSQSHEQLTRRRHLCDLRSCST